MALIPYEGMTLNLPEVDGEEVVVVNSATYASLVNASKRNREFFGTYGLPYWKATEWDGKLENSSNGVDWDERTFNSDWYIAIDGTTVYSEGSVFAITKRGQGISIFSSRNISTTSLITTVSCHALHVIIFNENVLMGNYPSDISPLFCNDLYCVKNRDYYTLYFKSSESSATGVYLRVHKTFFFYDDGVPEPSNKYRVRPSWKSLIDPNDSAGESSSGGGNGTHDNTSDIITPAALPTVSAAQAGVITLFKPSLDNLKSLNSYLWTNVDDFVPNLQKMFSNPMDYIIAFNIFPVNPDVGAERNIKLGLWETTVTMPPILSQWYEFSCGSILIPEYWGSALDYAPNTKISCMLPFIGSVQLNTDEVMGKSLDIKYRIDLLSGSCVAILSVNGSVYYQFTGECGVSIPLTGADWSRVYSAAIGAIGTAISGGMAAAGVGAATGAGMSSAAKMGNALANQVGMANKIDNAIKTLPRRSGELYNALKESQKSIMGNALNQAAKEANESRAISASRVASTVNNTVGAVMGGKVSIQHSGSISGSAGMLGVRRPFITIEYPNQSLAENYKHFVGYPSNIFAKLSDVSGYTECEQVIIENFPGTDGELAEVLEALKGGVYL